MDPKQRLEKGLDDYWSKDEAVRKQKLDERLEEYKKQAVGDTTTEAKAETK